MTSISPKLEPAIWSRDTDKRIPGFGRCQLTITWMSNIWENDCINQVYMSLSTYQLEYGRHRCCEYTPTINAASHDNHDKSNSWVSFSSLYEYGAPLGDPSHYNVIMYTVKIQMYTRRTFATEDDIGMSKHVARLGNTAEGNGYQSISVTEEELTASLATSVQKFVTLNSKFFIITFQANEFTDSRYLSPLIRMLWSTKVWLHNVTTRCKLIRTSMATVCLARSLQACSYICALWIPRPQKMANACRKTNPIIASQVLARSTVVIG